MIRLFLDANILFSAAWREGNGLMRLWERPDVERVTSPYALREAERNIQLKRPDATERLARLVASVEVSAATRPLSTHYDLPTLRVTPSMFAKITNRRFTSLVKVIFQ